MFNALFWKGETNVNSLGTVSLFSFIVSSLALSKCTSFLFYRLPVSRHQIITLSWMKYSFIWMFAKQLDNSKKASLDEQYKTLCVNAKKSSKFSMSCTHTV